MKLQEIDIEQRHSVHEHGHETWTEVHVPDHAETVSEELARYVYAEFGIELETEYDLEVV